MLPTFPKIIALRAEANEACVKAMVRELAPQFGMIKHNIQFEGSGHSITRADDTVSHTELEGVSGEVGVKRGSPLSEFTPDVVDEHLANIARQIAEGSTKQFYKVMERATREAGMVIDAKGGPATEGLILDALDRMEHTFDEDGTWNPPTIIAPKHVVELFAGKDMSPEGQARLAEILERKRNDFRRRQAGRVLAG
jgi:hypothetical protein